MYLSFANLICERTSSDFMRLHDKTRSGHWYTGTRGWRLLQDCMRSEKLTKKYRGSGQGRTDTDTLIC
jgi:hypothetical protein